MLSNRRIPVFFHIPKAAGTSVQYDMLSVISNGYNGDDRKLVQSACVTFPNGNMIECIIKLTDPVIIDNDVIKPYPIYTKWKFCIMYETLVYMLNEGSCTLHGIIINPVGELDFRDTVFKCRGLCSLVKVPEMIFSVLRDPFSKAKSMYTYYKSDDEFARRDRQTWSKGREYAMTFEEYLCSGQVEDGWFIRAITGVRNDIELKKEWYELAVDFSESQDFQLFDIKQTTRRTRHILRKCFKETVSFPEIQTKNKSSTGNIYKTIDDLPEDVRSKFLSRTAWDYNFYNYYCRNKWFK